MKDINDLRRARKAAADNMQGAAQAIGTLEGAGGEPDVEALNQAQATFDAAEVAFEAADKAVKRAERVEAAQAAALVSEADEGNTNTVGGGVPALAKTPGHEGIEVGFMVHALANAKGDKDKAVASLDADGHTAISAALSGATEAAGGVTIPRPQAAQVIEMLRPRVAVRNAGARVHDMPAGEIRNARMTSGASATYGAESVAAVESEPTFDKVEEKFRTLRALVPIGNQLLRHSSASVALLVRDDLVKSMALKNDLAFLRFDGTGDNPKGLRNWALAANWQAAVAASAAVAEAAIRKCVSVVEDADVGLVKPGWIMRASAKNWLASLRDSSSGAYIFPSIESSGTLKGAPIFTTSQIPDNLGVGGDETEIYFADFDEIMIGDSQVITVASSTEASFVDVGGNTISAFQNDLTLMRAIAEHDLAPAHDVAISGINGVGWSL